QRNARPQAKAKQLDPRTRTDPVSWSTTFRNTWAIICQSVTGALGTDSDWVRGVRTHIMVLLETDQFQLGQASCLLISDVTHHPW
ncbi:hypothetical protein QBC32DRAFT_194029, partial [Pseudoneurospora amorphoporcata]